MPKRNLIWTIAIVAAGVVTVLITREAPPPDDPDATRFRPVVRAYRTLRDRSYRPAGIDDLRQGAVRGMVEQLDDFSSYVPPDRLHSFRARLDGRLGGTGLRIDVVGRAVEILGAMPGSPAHQAGIAPGGRLVAIDGHPVAGLRAGEIRKLLDAARPKPVELDVVDASGEARHYELPRGRFVIETVMGLVRGPDARWDYGLDAAEGIAYVRVREFVRTTAERLRRAVSQLSGARGLVLDLRGNPGGHLEIGFAAANLFLRNGVIFTRMDRRGQARSYAARADGTCPRVPMVVLIDGRTASAAELVAGALRRRDRAVLVGSRTRGKGFVQSMISLPDDLGQVNLTTAEFLVGTDVPIARRPGSKTWGVQPHRTLALSAAEQKALWRSWAAAEVAPAAPGRRRAASEPATRPATGPATRPQPSARRLDRQLALAARLLRTPGEIDRILAHAAAQRRRRQQRLRAAATRPKDANIPRGPAGDE